MVDGLEIYEKNYATTSKAMLKRAAEVWNKMN
jgi:hypothetical protein